MGFPFVDCLELAEGAGIAPASARADPVFETGAASLYLPAFRKIGCQTWTRTKTSGLTGRRATLTPPGNGAAGGICTRIGSFRRRTPHLVRQRQHFEIGSGGGSCAHGG